MGGGAGSDMGGAGLGLGRVAMVLAKEDGSGEKEGDHEEATDRGDDSL